MASRPDIEKIGIKVTTSSPVKGGELEIPEEYWVRILDHAHEAHRTYFLHENDNHIEGRTIKISADGEKYEWQCELRSACHDAEYECLYFRCITKNGDLSGLTSYPVDHTQYFVVIPDKANGNTRLKSVGDKLVAMSPQVDGEKGIPKLDNKAAWEYLENYLEDLVIEHHKKKGMVPMLEGKIVRLDKMASMLQEAGMYEEAKAIDTISNTLEAADTGTFMIETPEEATRDLKSAWRSIQRSAPQQQTRLYSAFTDPRKYGPEYGQALFNIAKQVAENPSLEQAKQQEWNAVYNKAMFKGKLQPATTPATQDSPFTGQPVKRQVGLGPQDTDEFFIRCASGVKKLAEYTIKELKRKELYKEAFELWSILESLNLG